MRMISKFSATSAYRAALADANPSATARPRRPDPAGIAGTASAVRGTTDLGAKRQIGLSLFEIGHGLHFVRASVGVEHRQTGIGVVRAAWDPRFEALIAPNAREFLHHNGLKPIIDGGRQFFHWHVCKSVHSL